MEDEGSSSNRGKQEMMPEATEVNAISSTSSSSMESSKISGLDWSASSRESGSTSSTLVAMKIAVQGMGVMSK
jgi:hypothetical protein